MLFNFFALVRENSDTQVYRIALGNQLQADISDMFSEQKDDFINENFDVIPFDGQYKPEHEEVLAIGGFELPDEFKDAINNPMALYPLEINAESESKIVAIFCGTKIDDDYSVLIQLFEGTRLIKPNRMNIVFGGDHVFTKLENSGMTLDSKLTAYYENHQLHFKSYHFTRRIFDLSNHYREATNQEVAEIFSHQHFAVVDQELMISIADHVVRQTIARILRNEVLDNFTVLQLTSKASEVNLKLNTNEEQKILLPEEKKELKLVLSFLDDQVFLGPITGLTRVSNSSRVIA